METRGRDEEVALLNVQAVINSYAIEIALKSFWALDHPGEPVRRTHNFLKIFDGLKDETKKSLGGLQLTRQELENTPELFISNRYSMERDRRVVILYRPLLLRKLAQILRDTLEDMDEEIRKALLTTVTLSDE